MATDPIDELRRLPMGELVTVVNPDGRRWHGRLVPAHELSGDRIIQLKLESGYNVGVRVDPGAKIEHHPAPASSTEKRLPVERPPTAPSAPASGPVALLTTGGTIASRVDYQTGGVRPVHGEREILSFFPELEQGGPVRVVRVLDKLSEDVSRDDWVLLAHQVEAAFRSGAVGVVIAHGTDTLQFTASALSFLLEGLPGPVVLVGAQRSPDRPSSDGFTNMAAAVRVAREPDLYEVVVVMHAGLSDDQWAVHRGTRVRKMHSSRRDAFATRNEPPLGRVANGAVSWEQARRPRSGTLLAVTKPPDGRGALLWMFPGLDPTRAAEFARTLRGLVLAGTGLGHTAQEHLAWIRAATGRGAVVAMTTQTLGGSVDPYVYATGRELLRAGVVFAGDMLPETAYVKLLWALGQSDDPAEVTRLFLADRAGEMVNRHTDTGAVG
ncbi:MAG: Glu-tRNA(Gln) amidotransferase subunit GatD [Thermoplasmata archaeon]|nr:Glu-tRNA(Gln) amidotransferase subunit GatD [Thermoplasmata archaeon]